MITELISSYLFPPLFYLFLLLLLHLLLLYLPLLILPPLTLLLLPPLLLPLLLLLLLFVITEKPITSMLRGLSAPVKMRFQQSDEDLALIMVSTLLCTVRYTTLRCTVRYRTLQCTVRYRTLQCISLHFIAIYCSIFKCDSIIELRLEYCYVGTLMQIDKRISHTHAYKHFLTSGPWTVIYHIDTQRSEQLEPTRCEPIPLTTKHNTTNQIKSELIIRFTTHHNTTQHNTIEHI